MIVKPELFPPLADYYTSLIAVCDQWAAYYITIINQMRQRNGIVQEPNVENSLDLIFVPSSCEKAVTEPDVSFLQSENSC